MGKTLTKQTRPCLVQLYPSVLVIWTFQTTNLHTYHGTRYMDLQFLHSVLFFLVYRYSCQNEGNSTCC